MTDKALSPLDLLDQLEGSRLVANIMHFGRILRAAGLPVGTGKILDGVNAICEVGVGNRTDFYWALHAVFINRRDQHEMFDQAFHIFWRDPKIMERMMGIMLPQIDVEAPIEAEPPSRRIQDALSSKDEGEDDEEREREEEIEFDAAMTASARELLQEMDFEDMSADEIAQAKAEIPTRRFEPATQRRRVDMRATLRTALRSGGATIPLRWRDRRTRTPPLVILCDISGSMSRYTRMFIHFMHTLTNDRDRVHTFLFGTRLTNVTRYLRHKDIDVALAKVTNAVEDWSGGTRIGESLAEFNRHWSRRVLGQGAVVILISDGLDRDAGRGLTEEMDRLHKSCRRLIWLNPLLRFEGFEPKSQGIRAILPQVDDFRPIHNLLSLGELIEALSRPPGRRREGMDEWLRAM
jgi:hypothetical protein